MRKKLILAFILVSNLTFSQWTDLNLNANCNSVIEVNDNENLLNMLVVGTETGVSISNSDNISWTTASGINDKGISFYEYQSELYLTSNEKLFKSTDYGLSWSIFYEDQNLNQDINNVVKFENNIVLGMNRSGIKFSPDNGVNWYNSGTSWQSKNSSILKVGNELYSSSHSSGYLQKCNDLTGQSWGGLSANGLKFPFSSSYPDIKSLNLLNNKIIIAGVNETFNSGNQSGVFFSSDNGDNWEKRNTGLNNIYVESVVSVGNLIFAGTENGVYYSTNEGNSWLGYNENLTNLNIKKLYIKNSNLYACTNTGIFRTNICNLINGTSQILPEGNIEANTDDNLILEANTGGISYQWFLNDIEISDSNSRNYTPNESGVYKVQILYSENCSDFSNSVNVTIETLSIEETEKLKVISFYPNPVIDFLNIENTELNGEIYKVFDNSGKLIKKGRIEENRINFKNYSKGIYFIVVNGKYLSKILK